MSKTKTTATKAKAPKATKGGTQIKKDGKGRFWLVPKDGSAELGPFETKQAALAGRPRTSTAPLSRTWPAFGCPRPRSLRGSALLSRRRYSI